MSYDNTKQVILRKVQSDNPKAPALQVEFEFNGQKYRAGLWNWTRKDGSPVTDKNGNGMYIGDYERDTYAEEQQQQGMEQAKQAAQPEPELVEDEIPFS